MHNHRFSLDTSRPTKLFPCPACGKKTFKRYVDNEQNEYMSEEVGRCNREVNCGYHFKPKEYFSQHRDALQGKRAPFDRLRVTHRAADRLRSARVMVSRSAFAERKSNHARVPETPPPAGLSIISLPVFKSSLSHYNQNNFITYLNTLFDKEITQQLINKYYIGTSKHWPGANIFWQVDRYNKIRSGKVMQYNPTTGKRDKVFTWAHSLLSIPDFQLKQCLFGEHLLNTDLNKPIAIAEGEKTAIIASIYLPELIWMATGGLGNLSIEKLLPLKSRKLVLYPDLLKPNAEDKWTQVYNQLLGLGFNVSINHTLETIATNEDKLKGLDVADYLVRIKNSTIQVAGENTSKGEKVKTKDTIHIHTDAAEPLKRMIAKNPAIQTMMDKLGIVEVSVVR